MPIYCLEIISREQNVIKIKIISIMPNINILKVIKNILLILFQYQIFYKKCCDLIEFFIKFKRIEFGCSFLYIVSYLPIIDLDR